MTPAVPVRGRWELASILVAGVAGLGIVVAPATVAAAVAAAAVGVLIALGGRARLLALFAVVAAVPVAAGLGAGVSAPVPLSLLDDVVLLFGLVGLAGVTEGMRPEVRRLALGAFLLLVAGELIALASSHGGLVLGAEAAWQDLRWLGAIGWGLYLGKRLRPRERVAWAFWLLLFWNLAQIAVVVIQISLDQSSPVRFGFPQAGGALGHASLGAIAGTMLLVLVVSDALSPSSALGRRYYQWGTATALVGLLVSTRVKPLLAVVAILLFYLTKRLTRSDWQATAVAGAVALVFLFALPFAGTLYPAGSVGPPGVLADIAGHAGPRVSLFTGAKTLAAQEFPFGWGLGTFGSNLSPATEDQAFAAAGLSGRYGFDSRGFDAKAPSFRYDSLMAHVLGERGWLGLSIWFGALLLLTLLTARISPRHLFPVAAIIGALSLAPITPSIQDATIALMMILPAAVCLSPAGRSPAGEEVPSLEPHLQQ